MEKWKPIPFYVGNYEVSNKGNIRNCKTKRHLKFGMNNRGYWLTTLWRKNKQRTFSVHRLVAIAFIRNPHQKDQVNHKDSNKSNNRAKNLQWMTGKENIRHSIRNNTFKRSTK